MVVPKYIVINILIYVVESLKFFLCTSTTQKIHKSNVFALPFLIRVIDYRDPIVIHFIDI